ncbi:sphingomyelin phosphodiesterase [Fistulina hepatica ATCC 64428]|uniref:Sphingomyelin phosphodiesterase n=1 Tax=Fistulina hepatica ATCC 64428 TaxID=1128425 RepID=A0A0D7ALK0_9AGAR|nr:sphingomyelin phosphodiesterase [Fistulina hepatica ATCC 64428]
MRRILIASVVHFLAAGSLAAATASSSASASLLTAFTAPGAFPTFWYPSYYNNPTGTASQVQPIVSDPVTNETYSLNLTSPDSIPDYDTVDPHPLPPTASSDLLLQLAIAQIKSIAANPVFGNDTCTQCLAGLEVAKFLALAAPEQGPALAVAICEAFDYESNCTTTFGIGAIGSPITQVVANADVGGYDGQLLCQNFLGLCDLPPASPLNLTSWFAKPKPNPLPVFNSTGERLKVLHLSDLHIDPRYATGFEADCSSYPCCRENVYNSASPDSVVLPAPRFGAYLCDSPFALIAAALEAIPPLTETEDTGFAYTIYTGDLVSHDSENQLSRSYVEYAETVLYDLIRNHLGSGPVYVALGNHDTYNEAQDAPHSLGGALAEQFSWNYDHVAGLWEYENWLSGGTVKTARSHYGAYSVQRSDGLRIITLNTDFCKSPNYFNYINLTSHDTSGILRFLTDELQDAEDSGERVWILGHVLSGWDGTNPLLNPTDLFYQIVDRYSPHVIANIFFGHTHEDQLTIFYANNATNISVDTAQTQAWICPSVVPITNLNSGFRMYEVDSGTFEILDAHTWKADVNTFSTLDNQTANGPVYSYEYNTRETYGSSFEWGANDPLNATWWHKVTEAMEANSSIVQMFHKLQGKSSVETGTCDDTCVEATICYMRSGSAPLAIQNCPAGYGSVQ